MQLLQPPGWLEVAHTKSSEYVETLPGKVPDVALYYMYLQLYQVLYSDDTNTCSLGVVPGSLLVVIHLDIRMIYSLCHDLLLYYQQRCIAPTDACW